MFGLMGNGSGAVADMRTARVTGQLPAEDITAISAATGNKKEADGIGYRGIGINYGFKPLLLKDNFSLTF